MHIKLTTRQEQIGIISLICFCFLLLFRHFSPQHLLGFHGAEVYGHAWTHVWRFQEFPSQFFGTRNALGVENFPPIDIIPLLVSNCFGIIGGPIVGYNLWVVFSVILAGTGGYVLAKIEKGDPWVGAIVLSCSPIFLGTIYSGLTEDMGLGLAALSIAFLRKRSFWGVFFLALVGYSGLVLGWMTGIVALLVGIVDIKKHPNYWKHWLGFACITFILLSPLFWIHSERLAHQGHRFGSHLMELEPFWMLNPWKQGDIASLFALGAVDFSGEIIRLHPSYLGLSLLIVSIFARSRFWWSLFFSFTLVSLGSSFRFLGTDSGILNPFRYLLELVPGYSLINHHGRFMLLSLVGWSVLVAKGAKYAQKWLSIFWIVFILLLDLIFFSPIGFSLPQTGSYTDTILKDVDLKQDGFLLRLPMMGPEISFQEALWEQIFHEEKLLLSPNRPGIQPFSTKTKQTEWMETLGFPDSTIPADFCIPERISGLLVLDQWSSQVQEKLGDPDVKDSRYSFWLIESQKEYYCD